MLVIHALRARLRGDDSRLVILQDEFKVLLDAEWNAAQLAQLEAISRHIVQARVELAVLIELTPRYELPTEHHDDTE